VVHRARPFHDTVDHLWPEHDLDRSPRRGGCGPKDLPSSTACPPLGQSSAWSWATAVIAVVREIEQWTSLVVQARGPRGQSTLAIVGPRLWSSASYWSRIPVHKVVRSIPGVHDATVQPDR
jgi:hypothetical protein